MTSIWYPGRPPLRAPEIITALKHYAYVLQNGRDQRTGDYLEKAARLCEHAATILEAETADCLGSDTDINDLLVLLPQTLKAARACTANGAWDVLTEVIDSIEDVRWAMVHQLDAAGVTHG